MSSSTPLFLWFISKVRFCSIYVHDVYVDWNVPCISYGPKCCCGRLRDFILWYATLRINLSMFICISGIARCSFWTLVLETSWSLQTPIASSVRMRLQRLQRSRPQVPCSSDEQFYYSCWNFPYSQQILY